MADHLEIAGEDSVIRDIEARECSVEANVSFCNVLAKEVGLVGRRGEVGFEAVKGFEEGVDSGVVGLLGSCEAALVDTIVDGVVDPLVHLVDLLKQVIGEEAAARLVGFAEVWLEERVEGGVEHADDFGGFVVYDREKLLIP